LKELAKVVFLAIFILFTCKLSADNPKFNLLADTPISIVLLDHLQSGVNRKGSRINFKVAADVCDSNGNILIEKGTPAYGTVISSRKRGYFGRRGSLEISIDFTTSVDGQNIALNGQKKSAGGGNKALGIAATVLWLPMGLMRGSNVTIKSGTKFEAFVSESLNVKTSNSSNSGEAIIDSAQHYEGSSAKTIKLKNGEQVNGKLLSLQNGLYVVQTSMGELRIKEEDVVSIKEESANAEPGTDREGKTNLEKKLEELRNKHK